jgi:hypothetical protein
MAGLNGTGRDRPAHPALGIAESRPEDESDWVGRRPEEPLELVALGEAERGEGICASRDLELVAQAAQPGRRAGRVAPGANDVPEKDDAERRVHRQRLTDSLLAVND